MESRVILQSEAHLNSDNTAFQDSEHGVAPSAPIHLVPQQPVKKQTRQWAAWTRQEEENFFTALRQVGKNFEKITCRVQSKNKDQVRHYYYRLVRRMNKLLGPGLYLDAKNSKDTNAAMLRWWSLLEKYSCKASKLHLKPRRFKIFIEALEHQLLKDRKKSVRKRPTHGDYCPPTPNTVTNQGRTSGHDNRTVKLVLVDSQNIQKVGSGKAPLKRNVNLSINRSNNKGDSTTMKPARQQRRKPGVVSSAAYKKWEKAAIAGVSLVADAAEHLERTSTDKELEQNQSTSGQKKSSDPAGQVLFSLPNFPQNPFAESNINSSMKLKLQLFPIDDGTRRALEMDKHNPHLELTLSNRKRISSVLEHLNRKWGSSKVASGELVLFPYSVQKENIVGHQSWTQDSVASAADVYAMIGSPQVFRLRYGWIPTAEHGFATLQEKATLPSCSISGEPNVIIEKRDQDMRSSTPMSVPSTAHQSMDLHEDNLASVNKNHASALISTNVLLNERRYSSAGPSDNLLDSSDPTANKFWHGKGAGGETSMRQLGDTDDIRLSNGSGLSPGEWADSLTNISVGDLLSGVSQDMKANCIDPPVAESAHCLQQMPFSCDSFDAAIAAHISRQQDKMGCQPTLVSSIWDAEETCDGFLFQKNHVHCQEAESLSGVATPNARKQTTGTNLMESIHLDEELSEVEGPTDDSAQGDPMDDRGPDSQLLENPAKDFSELADIYWPESLGPLDLDIPSSKYHSEDLILSDSLSGLNRLIASSLDAFQNCSFFGLDKKESASTVEARESISFSDFKIGSGL
ncbi:TSL-kinase interacting protein 1 [Humulus lupulus]|uniref:TSL-kinase interacting protein 1 n=1 Tax=Humulus lupulus TaxID=3486 RepID=UPI002B40FB2C|nr:TSL-kinase interacting protein 1 [Humulus lupulus]XP_062117292.1 TSL-kinase interacting protein 1 [Humulus lupulus]XP_062117293.1 TSL-kinase interacting protein 1 [Humulus lupulus]